MQDLDLNSLPAAALAWIENHVLLGENLLQGLYALAVLGLAWLLARPVRAGYRGWLERRGRPLAPRTLRNATDTLILPALWLLLLYLGMLGADSQGWPRPILKIGASLLTAWVVIRYTSLLIRDAFLRKSVALAAWAVAALNILGLLRPTLRLLDGLAFRIGDFNLSLLTVIKGFIYLAVFLWVAGLISRFLEERLRASTSLTPSMAVLTGKIARITLVTVAFLVAVSSVGIDLTIFTLFGGALGVGLGFGLQKVVSNFVSGIILLLDKSIKPGDVISIGETYGWVKSLNARYVSLDTRDGIEHLIPNEELIIQRVENWSYSHNRIRLKIPVGVHYKSDVRRAIALCLEAAREQARIIEEPPPVCLLKGFGDSSVDLEIRCWINDPQNGISNIKSDILLAVWDRFHEHGVEIPYPQRDVHIKETPAPPAA